MYILYNTCDMKQYEIGLQTWLLWPLLRPFRKDKMSWEELGKPEELQAGPFFQGLEISRDRMGVFIFRSNYLT